MKPEQYFEIVWYRPGEPNEIGPRPETERLAGRSLAAVRAYARRIAEERGWRVFDVARVPAPPAEDGV